MATLAGNHGPGHSGLALASGEGPGLAIGIAQPDIPWTLHAHDLTRGVMVLGGQGSGKSTLLYRLLGHRAMAPDTALVVFDMKGSLVERLLRRLSHEIPKRWYDHDAGEWREGHKRVWYLDLANAAFGLTPLEVREGWTTDGLADAFVHVAGLIVNALRDLFPDQIFQASQDIITRTVIGTMAIAWWEHVEHHRTAGTRPQDFGFSGSFETLSRMLAPSDDAAIARGRDRTVPPNPWHVAAGRACQRIRGLDETAYQLLVAIPAAVNANLNNMTQRFQAPANKITPLVAQYPAVRRFVEQRQRLSLQSIVEAHDILIINPRIEVLGEEAPEIVTTFVVHMLNAQLNRHLRFPSETRPRLTIGMDEAHRLITPTLVRMLATHREAGLSFIAATQYFAQIAASVQSPAMQEFVRAGIRNLVQTVMIGRTSDPAEAEVLSQNFRTVFDSLIRSGPDDQARIPVDASNIATLPDYLFLVRAITGAHDGVGTQALPVFRTRTLAMPEVHEISNYFRRRHLRRMEAVFGRPEDQDDQAFVRTPPAGLTGDAAPATGLVDVDADAADVARATVGRKPERRPSQPRSGERDEWTHGTDTDTAGDDTNQPAEALSEDVGGAKVHRRPVAPAAQIASLVAVLKIAMRPTSDGAPDEDAGPPWPLVADAARRAAQIEALDGLGAWESDGHLQLADTNARVRAARQAALVRGQQEGLSEAATKRLAAAAGARAKSAAEAMYIDQPWQIAVDRLSLSSQRLQLLRVLAQLPYSHPQLLAPLLAAGGTDSTIAKALQSLREAALVAQAPVRLDRPQGGKPVLLWTVTGRGRERLRSELKKAGKRVPDYLGADRKLPGGGEPLQGKEVPHNLAVQVLAGALRQYGATDVKCSWMTPEMPGATLDIATVRKHAKTVEVADLVPPAHPTMAVLGYSRAAQTAIAPDLSVRLDGHVGAAHQSISILIEVDRTARPAYNEPKMVAYDHLLAGWYVHLTRRFGDPPVRPLVLFVARDQESARSLARRADALLCVGIGLPGQDPKTYVYFGRTHTAFTCLSWMLAGTPYAMRVPAMPAGVRGPDMPSELELVELLPKTWWPRQPTSASRIPRDR